ncbi:hypothetical protein UT300005_02380 [Clostridium sp. CTA-5]
MNSISKLKIGDSIGIFSPLSPITYSCPNRFERAKKYLQSKGFKIIEGDILFIEDSLQNCADIERSFSLLKVSGVLDKISGIILGKYELFGDSKTGRKPHEILLEVLGERKIPFSADFDCCYTYTMITLPIGCKIELDATNKKVSIL